MKVALDRRQFVAALAGAQGIQIPSLGPLVTFRMEGPDAEGRHFLTLEGMDYDLLYRRTIGIDSLEGKPLEVVANARVLYELVGAWQGDELACDTDGKVMQLRCGKQHARVLCRTKDDVPQVNFGKPAFGIDLPAGQLGIVAEAVAPFQSQEEARMNLNGVRFEAARGGVELVATDGRRLIRVAIPCEVPPGDWHGVTLYRRGVGELARMLNKGKACGVVRCQITDSGHTVFAHGNTTVAMRDVDEGYPDYSSVIPAFSDNGKITMDPGAFGAALRAVSALADPAIGAANLQPADGVLTVQTESATAGKGTAEVEYSGACAPVRLSLAYLNDALKALGTEYAVALQHAGGGSPVLLYQDTDNPAVVVVIMPMEDK